MRVITRSARSRAYPFFHSFARRTLTTWVVRLPARRAEASATTVLAKVILELRANMARARVCRRRGRWARGAVDRWRRQNLAKSKKGDSVGGRERSVVQEIHVDICRGAASGVVNGIHSGIYRDARRSRPRRRREAGDAVVIYSASASVVRSSGAYGRIRRTARTASSRSAAPAESPTWCACWRRISRRWARVMAF